MAAKQEDVQVTAAGHRLRVRWFSPRRSPAQSVIILLHQGLGSVTQWRNFPEALAAATGAAVVGYDRWGHGASDPLDGPRPPSFLEEEAVLALPDVLGALDLDDVVLYGHSDGASIALLFAGAFPERARAVISEAAHVFSETGSASGFSEVLAAFESGDLRARLARHHGGNVDSMFRGWADVWRSPAMHNWSMADRLPAIRCPVFVLQGEKDDHGTVAQLQAIVNGVSGNVESWLVPACGHSPHLEATDAVVGRVADFLRRVLPVSGA
jgi:pimeloyl-ACP methyl ester carboxylesterase